MLDIVRQTAYNGYRLRIGETKMKAMERYTVIVQEGEVVDGNLKKIMPSIKYSCGHEHRTYEAAEKCQKTLRGGHYEQNTYVESARWYNSYIYQHDAGTMEYEHQIK
jgi:deoxyinosine 3'endonuclease (endonuclease V)